MGNLDPLLLTALGLLFGLIVGSFLNVVIYRLPVILERRWRRECREHLDLPDEPQERFSLAFPPSRCPQCQTPIRPWHNIPLVSYLLLGGKCSECKAKIPLRYPLVELLTGLLCAFAVWTFGLNLQGAAAVVLLCFLVALTFIDLDHHLLPDSMTLPLIWLGLLLNTRSVFTDPVSAIIGAVAGYLVLWGVFHLFRLLTGKEGMGYGDFKLLAAFGAWFGWQLLAQILILSSMAGALIGISLILVRRHEHDVPIPFGPYLALAGVIALFFGQQINAWYLGFAGLI
ncbi:MAG: A24 family peptidase [Gammaproteobacteria bacterium]|jgi:leader peptidase (prepilin peptidase) / N-methyltransferase